MNNKYSYQNFAIDGKTSLDFAPAWPDPVHQFTKEEAAAVMAALWVRRPLLIEGAPGSGKSQIAAAAASVLDRELLTFVVNSNTEPEALLWRFDALRRLNDAQANDVKSDGEYLSRGPLWLAYAPDQGSEIKNTVNTYCPQSGGKNGKVVLIDEIDKADRSVPNTLLEVFGNRRFSCPYFSGEIGGGMGGEAPLIIITSNCEQQLPPAFVRRCLVLKIEMPDAERLAERGAMHFGDKLAPDQYLALAKALWELRDTSGLSPELQPGQAEYIDLIRAITESLANKLSDHEGKPLTFDQLLNDMQQLAFNKMGAGR